MVAGIIVFPTKGRSQNVTVTGQIFEYVTYYMSNFDVQSGSSDIQLFRYLIQSDTYPVYCKVWFKASMVSPSLGVTSATTIVELESNVMQLLADLALDNRYFTVTSDFLYDQASPPNTIPLEVTPIQLLDPQEFDAMMSSIMTTGQLADGEYTFEIKIYAGADELGLSLVEHDSKTIIVQTPTAITLESPGGNIEDTTQTIVYTTYPFFNWSSQGCNGCETLIRVAEYDPSEHASIDEAIEGETSLPASQSLGWENIGSFSSYQYPVTGARPLGFGKLYVWQVKKSLSTTGGMEELISNIYTFKVADPAGGTANSAATFHPVLEGLRQALGDDQFNALFGPGSALDGYSPQGVYTIDDQSVDESSITYLLNQVINQNISVINVNIED
ncbi:MAG: hypothetical protein HOG68_03455 [Candidatus Marinimicrobia bacterium]|jgi:hypothetical protein|nr:hypothetical protein [Candidatus Neomarinimicrobiota bacterium]MBT3217418.1 hypothetical protein [Candidatus Neomarinimicrobiota bacterium]MBT3996681.1 hypothetical protein [Candidatus Neomarinimicrobiota bacterium]MBT6000068.1 hypothetical protein [Candidatus Neomarinimicrobiota bacterium]MBT6709105.1 hypothetical protein [Candidatus Neomarinimicrobiota bacterium]